MKDASGFTLIELMIVVAIIGIIAMIAIPAILESRKAANEKAGMSALRTIMAAEETFRQVNGDRNPVTNYWAADVWGLYGIQDATGGKRAWIDQAVGASDYNHQSVATGANNTSPADYDIAAFPASEQSQSGYFVAVFLRDGNGNAIQEDLDGDGNAYESSTKYAFQAFPEEYDSTGNNGFIVNQEGTIWIRDGLENCGGGCSPFNDKADLSPMGTKGQGGTPPMTDYPGRPENAEFHTN